jgi:formyl-CoA transferase
VAPSNLFKSKDGKWVVIAANQDTVFRRLCEAMDLPELATDERFKSHLARGKNQEKIEAVVADWAGEHDAAEIDRVLNEAGVVCGPVYSIADIFEDAQYQARDMLLEHHDAELGSFAGPGIVPKFSKTPGEVRWSGPWEVGAHNHEVYGELLGLSEVEIGDLRRERVV